MAPPTGHRQGLLIAWRGKRAANERARERQGREARASFHVRHSPRVSTTKERAKSNTCNLDSPLNEAVKSPVKNFPTVKFPPQNSTAKVDRKATASPRARPSDSSFPRLNGKTMVVMYVRSNCHTMTVEIVWETLSPGQTKTLGVLSLSSAEGKLASNAAVFRGARISSPKNACVGG